MHRSASEATTELFERYSGEIFRYALFVLSNPSDAQDAVQEVFIRVFNAWDNFRQVASERTWSWTITRNYLKDWRRKHRWNTVSLDANVSLQGLPSVFISQLVEWEDALRALSLPQRQVIYWLIVEDRSVADTVELLGWTPNKVRVTLHRAIRVLRQTFPQMTSAPIGKGRETNGF